MNPKVRNLKDPLILFLTERDWLRFNNKDSLAKTLFIECGELATAVLDDDEKDIAEECGDVLSALLQIDMLRSDETGVSLGDEELSRLLREPALDLSKERQAERLLSFSSRFFEEGMDEKGYYALYEEIRRLFFSFLNLLALDPKKALLDKLALTAEHYPVSKCKGKATKYTDL